MKTWFKFYGQEFLSDPKMLSLTALERSLWLTLLCLGSSSDTEGVVKYIDEDKIKVLTNLSPLDEEWDNVTGFLKKFEELGMITLADKSIVIKNFEKRQDTNLTGYERVKRYREKQKDNKDNVINDNVDDNANDNVRIEKNRIEKNNNIVLSDKPKVTAKVAMHIRKPVDKQTQLQRVCYVLEDLLHTKIVNWGKQAKALDMMLKAGYKEPQIIWTIKAMAADEFFEDKGFDLMTVANNIDKYKAKARKVLYGSQQT